VRIYNTLTRRKEELKPIEPGKIRMYVCGPTVYDKAHVGHAMSSVTFDIIRRHLEYRGFEVNHVMNYTDVEDKIIARANEMGLEPIRLAEKYMHEYEQHLQELNVLPARQYPRASQEIQPIIDMISGLIKNEHAYVVDGDVYFRVLSAPQYGKLSGRKLEDMRAGFRKDVDQRKEEHADFALWKTAKPGEPAWEAPWGQGRPGWHIECSSMCLTYLGEEIDIHGGGNDLIFPHHENEIAQSECFSGKPFARYWMHNGMLQLAGEKMSKSVGDLITIDAFLEEHSADIFRMVVLNSHYRSPLTFNDEVLEQAHKALARLMGALRENGGPVDGNPESESVLRAQVSQTTTAFESAMDEDFNAPSALAALFDLARTINQTRDAGGSTAVLSLARAELRRLAGNLGLQLEESTIGSTGAAPFIDVLVDVRNRLRDAQQWDLADLIRDELERLDVSIEDSRGDTSWRFR